jgi:hypothetical protein
VDIDHDILPACGEVFAVRLQDDFGHAVVLGFRFHAQRRRGGLGLDDLERRTARIGQRHFLTHRPFQKHRHDGRLHRDVVVNGGLDSEDRFTHLLTLAIADQAVPGVRPVALAERPQLQGERSLLARLQTAFVDAGREATAAGSDFEDVDDLLTVVGQFEPMLQRHAPLDVAEVDEGLLDEQVGAGEWGGKKNRDDRR